MERVYRDLGGRHALGHHVGDPARAVGGDDLDGRGALVSELVGERLELSPAVPLRAPHHASAVVVDDDGHVAAALLVARLVYPYPPQAVEPGAARAGVEVGGDAGAYASHGVPVDPHELRDRAPAASAGEPCDLVLEAAGEPARRRARPRHRLGPDAVLGAPDPCRRVLHVALEGPVVERPPPAGREPVVGVAAPPADRAARRALPGARRDDYGIPLDSDGFDHGAVEAGALLGYALVHARDPFRRLAFLGGKQSLSEWGPRCYTHAFIGRSTHTNPRRA